MESGIRTVETDKDDMAITPGGGSCLGPTTSSSSIARRRAESPVRPNYAPGTNPAGGVSVFGRDFTTLFRFAVIRTRPNRSTSRACARSAAGIHASHVSSGRSRFGRGRSFSRRCTGGAASNHTCVITTSRADDRFVTFTK